MLNLWDRNFVTSRTETDDDLRVPLLTGQDGKLMRGLTQENVEMNRQVAAERRRAVNAEAVLDRKISNEAERAKGAEKQLQANISEEKARAENREAELLAMIEALKARVDNLENP